MNYSREDFFGLMEKVEDQGGDHLDEMCKARKYTFTGDKHQGITLGGCGQSALFEIPYESFIDNKEHKVKVCAVDDDIGKWPRFQNAKAGA